MNIAYQISKKLDKGNPKIRVEKYDFNKGSILTNSHVEKLINQLENTILFWNKEFEVINSCIIEFQFNSILSKSKRLRYLIKSIGNDKNIVGAKFVEKEKDIVHSYVYKFDNINSLILIKDRLISLKKFLDKTGNITKDNSKILHQLKLDNYNDQMKIGLALEILRITDIKVPQCDIKNIDDKNIVHFYGDPQKIFDALNIKITAKNILEKSYTLSKEQLLKVINKAPYFLSNGTNLFFNQPKEEMTEIDDDNHELGNSSDEPIVGVIDIGFIRNSYLDNWVEFIDKRSELEKEIGDSLEDKFHGTVIDSLIIHGNDLNKKNGLEDNCGHFRVKHFCIANNTGTDIYQIMERIREIVEENYKTIKVYNLSMGTESQISKNFISPVSYLIDNLQAEFDVIFVVAGTNNNNEDYDDNYYIGSAADSINSIVVNSVKFNTMERTSYSRKGPALGFFVKPDVSYYGGDENTKIIGFNGLKKVLVQGTSIAAPFITRKVAYLIYKLGFSKEVAKALILDSASSWGRYTNPNWIGRGVVPVKIEDVVYCEDDEIRFIFESKIEGYETFNNAFPFYVDKKEKFPFMARTLMTYFPTCSIDKGVDYSNVEIDFRMGPIKKGKIKPISNDYQYEKYVYINEKEARNEFSKWDNVKRYIPSPNVKHRGKTKYDSNKWGFSFKTIFRNGFEKAENKYNINFGTIITLKNTNNENVTTDFIKLIQASDWIIRPIDINIINKIDVMLETEIKFD